MEKYTVEVYESTVKFVEVEADSKEQAESKVLDGEGEQKYFQVLELDTKVYDKKRNEK